MPDLVGPRQSPTFPLDTDLSAEQACMASIALDEMAQGKNPDPSLVGNLTATASWLERSAGEIAASGATVIPPSNALASAIRDTLVEAGIINPTTLFDKVTPIAKNMATRLAKAAAGGTTSINERNERNLASMRLFCVELSRALSARERPLEPHYTAQV